MSGQVEQLPRRLDALALDVVRSARSELVDAPTATLDSWSTGDAVVILLRYSRLRSQGARSARLAQLHHVELTERIGATIARLSRERLELRGSSFSPYRGLSALAFCVPDGRRSCPRNAASLY